MMKDMLNILVVEDDHAIQLTLEIALSMHGHQVTTAADGSEALRILRQTEASSRPDVILLDLMMPNMDGWQFRQEQLSDPSLSSIPTFVMSAHDFLHRAAQELQPVGQLSKPFDLETLFSSLGAVQYAS